MGNSSHHRVLFAASKNLLNTTPSSSSSIFTSSIALQTQHLLLNTRSSRLLSSNCLSRPTSNFHPFALKTSEFSHAAPPNIPPTVSLEGSTLSARLSLLMKKLKELGFEDHDYLPGQYNHLLCPMCKGGKLGETSISLHISEDGNSVVWFCFRGECGWHGNTKAFADVESSYGKLNQTISAKKRDLTVSALKLKPLCGEVLAYFAKRMISKETLRRNYVMQKTLGDQIGIAFTYRRNGALIHCKYRNYAKKFWQERDTEKIFYGLDDIKKASDIIIVEGEIDKLSLEEAGFRNCVSVPDGAPCKVSSKDIPIPDEDRAYKYLWNCKKYFEKASRIILATDGDPPGQALAEELARRLGKERCWRVKWPKENDYHFKDANEVLMNLGPEILKQTIKNAVRYPIVGT